MPARCPRHVDDSEPIVRAALRSRWWHRASGNPAVDAGDGTSHRHHHAALPAPRREGGEIGRPSGQSACWRASPAAWPDGIGGLCGFASGRPRVSRWRCGWSERRITRPPRETDSGRLRLQRSHRQERISVAPRRSLLTSRCHDIARLAVPTSLAIRSLSHEKRLPQEASSVQRALQAHHSRSFTRSRAIDWLCSWHTRDSVTPSTAAISLRFMSCS
jgi:hypothetical protein